jgi:ubiquinone/menaquinone biosynthesis C-methylase UbiE
MKNSHGDSRLTSEEIRRGIAELSPWFYSFDFGNGLRTEAAIPPEVAGIHDTRLRMVESAVRAEFGDTAAGIDCLDIGCHEGYYSLAMARRGFHVTGVEPRDQSLTRARFVMDAMGVSDVQFRTGVVENLWRDLGRTFPLTLFLGVLYHVENPMLCLREVAAVTSRLCVIETQVIDEVEGATEWGSQQWTRPYCGVIALVDESGEFHAGNRETGVTPIATCPSVKALLFMLRQAGFRRAELIAAPDGAYEQHARGKRVVCAAYK